MSIPCDLEEPELTMLADCRIETIRETVRAWASQPKAVLADRADRALALVRRSYRPEDFSRTIRAALGAVLGERVAP